MLDETNSLRKLICNLIRTRVFVLLWYWLKIHLANSNITVSVQ